VVAVFFLILSALRLRRLPAEASYFTAIGFFSFGVSFGIFPFNLIGRIPPFTQYSNWRFYTFTAGLACAVLAGILLPRLWRKDNRKALTSSLVVLFMSIAASMALVVTQAGLPLVSAYILLVSAVTLAIPCLLLLALYLRRPWAIILLAAAELLFYDKVLSRPYLFPHPHRALADSSVITSCVPDDPEYRFAAYDEVIHPSLGILLDRYDFRSYEMMFPDKHARWVAAVNDWDRLQSLQYYLTHYYFAPEPEALSSPEVSRASLRVVLAEDFLPPSGLSSLIDQAKITAPGPEYFSCARERIGPVTRAGWFQHAPSAVSINAPDLAGLHNLAGFAAMSTSAWGLPGDGVQAQLIAQTSAVDSSSLVYARYFDPRRRRDERRWLEMSPGSGLLKRIQASALPGPRDDPRSDYMLWADFHDRGKRTELEAGWELVSAGDIKCYENRNALPRLRVAGPVEVVPGFEECIERVRTGRSKAKEESVIDESGNAWPHGRGKVTDVEWGHNRIDAQVEMDSEGTLILADNYFPGWQALVDGKPTRIHRADCAFRAIKVPAGDHHISFRFLPPAFRTGLWCGIPSWIIFLLVLAFRAGPKVQNKT
jgi:hypothetical protein